MPAKQIETDPPRRRWLKRFTIAAVIYALLILGVRLYWGYAASVKLQARIDAIKAAGDPIEYADFKQPVDEQSTRAIEEYGSAAGAWQLPAEEIWFDGPAEPIKNEQQYLINNQIAIDRARRAARAERCDFGMPLSPKGLPVRFSKRRLYMVYHLTDRLADAAQRHARLGNHREAVAIMRDLARLIDQLQESPTDHYALSVRDNAGFALARSIEVASHGLAVAGRNNPSDKAAQRADLLALINALLESSHDHETMTESMVGARGLICFEGGLAIANGRVDFDGSGNPNAIERIVIRLFRPMFIENIETDLDIFTQHIEVARQTRSYGEFDRRIWKIEYERPDYEWHRPIDEYHWRNSKINTASHYRALAQERMAACALAIRLYQIDHGKRPDKLEDLVPEYLPAVPLDPFSEKRAAISYRPEGVRPELEDFYESDAAKRQLAKQRKMRFAVLYTLDSHGEDGGGAFTLNIDNRSYGIDTNVFRLDPLPPVIDIDVDDDPYFDSYGYPAFGGFE